MSYNITSFRVKRIENFKIKDVFEKIYNFEDVKPEIFEIKIDKYNENIIDISYCGERSNTSWDFFWKNFLGDSTGYLEAFIIWEGGDTIEKIIVDNGKVTFKNFEEL